MNFPWLLLQQDEISFWVTDFNYVVFYLVLNLQETPFQEMRLKYSIQ